VKTYKAELLGKEVYERFGDEFPLLVKFIDAAEDLSIQVHPNDELAKARHNSFGKTEMWYVIDADKDATLISGFNQEIDERTYLEKFNSGKLMEILNKEKVEQGDVFFLPAGRVHTIGKGLLIAEIQQTSDITYRIYDFDRLDDKGNKRELHTEEAPAAIDYKYYGDYKTSHSKKLNEVVEVVNSPYFTTNILEFTQSSQRDYTALDSFVIHVCVQGSYTLQYEGGELSLKLGDCVLVPATINAVGLKTQSGFKILESFIV
jgi:mannose-6-phosphate isomerase